MVYKNLNMWCPEKNLQTITKNVMMVFLYEQAKKCKSLFLQAQLSVIKTCLNIYDNVDISKFSQLVSWYVPKKSKVSCFISKQNHNNSAIWINAYKSHWQNAISAGKSAERSTWMCCMWYRNNKYSLKIFHTILLLTQHLLIFCDM